MDAPEQLLPANIDELVNQLIENKAQIKPHKLVTLCHNGMRLQTEMGKERLKVAMDVCALFDKKQSDYGSKNIDAWGDKDMNILGVLVRINDKIQRLVNLTRKRLNDGGTPQVEDESLSDTAKDITNYGAILLLLLENRWK